jgi:hypothetical protein
MTDHSIDTESLSEEEREAMKRFRTAKGEWAHDALKKYVNHDENDLSTTMVDMLSDMMHLAEQNDLDFDALLGSAENHYHSEGGDEHDPDDIAVATATTDPRWA